MIKNLIQAKTPWIDGWKEKYKFPHREQHLLLTEKKE